MPAKVKIAEVLAQIEESWQPRVAGLFNDCEMRVAKFQGPFPWHVHTDTDELFLVLEGELVMEFRDRIERLAPGEILVIPCGTEHRSNCRAECSVMMIARPEQEKTE